MQNFVSFIVPAYNNEDTIGNCIESILIQTPQKEIIVVDNGSTDRTRNIIKKYPVKLLIEEKRGAGAARNRGLRSARGKFIAFVDADAILPKDWAVKALRTLEENKGDVVGVGGPLLSVEDNNITRALDALTFGKPRNIGRIYTNALNTSGVMFDMKILRKVKFDEEFVRGQDTEIGFRIRKKGYKLIYDSKLFIYHHNPSTFRGLLKKWFTYGRSYPLSYMKHKRMMNIGFYSRTVFLPILCLLLALALVWKPALFVACLQILSLFISYVYIGTKIPSKDRNIDIMTFSSIHTFKQMAQLTGIWFGFLERAYLKPIR